MNFKVFLSGVASVTLLLAGLEMARSQGTIFTYQGALNSNGVPVNGTYFLSFGLFTASSGGSALTTQTNAGVVVNDGLFTTSLNFGSVFTNGIPYFLQIGVGTNSTNAFVILSPRQPILPTPYAIAASFVNGTVAASQLTGTIPLSQVQGAILTNQQTGVTLTGTFSGDGSALINLNAGNLVSGTVADALLSTNVDLLNGNQIVGGAKQLTNLANNFSGNGGGLTNISGIATGVITAGMLQPAVAGRLAPPVFGDGSDSNVVISTPSILSRDVYCSNLTVTSTLFTGGYRIFVQGTCTITSPGLIANNGGSASGANLGLGAPAGSLGGGKGGAQGGTGAAGMGTNTMFGAGGNGGAGGNSASNVGGVGGTNTPVANTNGGIGVLRTFPSAFLGRDLAGNVIQGGAGGGGGAGLSGAVLSGGGGGGAGVIVLAAPLITGNGIVQAKGGSGGAGSSSGGGGGGGGGCIVIISEQAPVGVTFDVSGGTAGTTGSGSAGAAGTAGTLIQLY